MFVSLVRGDVVSTWLVVCFFTLCSPFTPSKSGRVGLPTRVGRLTRLQTRKRGCVTNIDAVVIPSYAVLVTDPVILIDRPLKPSYDSFLPSHSPPLLRFHYLLVVPPDLMQLTQYVRRVVMLQTFTFVVMWTIWPMCDLVSIRPVGVLFILKRGVVVVRMTSKAAQHSRQNTPSTIIDAVTGAFPSARAGSC